MHVPIILHVRGYIIVMVYVADITNVNLLTINVLIVYIIAMKLKPMGVTVH